MKPQCSFTPKTLVSFFYQTERVRIVVAIWKDSSLLEQAFTALESFSQTSGGSTVKGTTCTSNSVERRVLVPPPLSLDSGRDAACLLSKVAKIFSNSLLIGNKTWREIHTTILSLTELIALFLPLLFIKGYSRNPEWYLALTSFLGKAGCRGQWRALGSWLR